MNNPRDLVCTTAHSGDDVTFHYFSDLHIESGDDPLFGSLLRLIQKASRGDTLILAGDLFDLFVGSKPVFLDRFGPFFSELESAGFRGVQIQ